jgi:hypothetical protein
VVQSPPKLFAGDTGTLTIHYSQGSIANSLVGRTFFNDSWTSPSLEVQQIEVGPSQITLHFVSFAPGKQALPLIHLDDVLTLEGLSVETASIVEETGARETAPPYGQVNMPGALGLVYGSFGAIIFVVLIGFLLRRFGRPLFRRLRVRRVKLRLIRDMRRILTANDANHANKGEGLGKAGLAVLNQAFRDFISQICPFSPADDIQTFAFAAGASEFPQKSLQNLFSEIDEMRFQAEEPAADAVLNIIDKIDAFVRGTER